MGEGPPLFERDVCALVSDDIFRPNSDGDDDDDGCQDDRGVPSPDREGGGRGGRGRLLAPRNQEHGTPPSLARVAIFNLH